MAQGIHNSAFGRRRSAIASGLAGLVLLGAAWGIGTRGQYRLSAAHKRSERTYSSLRFDGDTLIGTSEKGTLLSVDRWTRILDRSWQVDLGLPVSAAKWAVGPNAGYVAWVAGSGMQVQPLAAANFAAPGTIFLDESADVKAVGFLPQGNIVAALASGSIEAWDAERLRRTGSWPLPDVLPQQAVFGPGTVVTAAAGQIQVFTFEEGQGWVARNKAVAPSAPFVLVSPERGEFAALEEKGVQIGRVGFQTDGAAVSVAHQGGQTLAAGAFGVEVLDPERPYALSVNQAGAIAWRPGEVVISSPSGTRWYPVGLSQSLTSMGWLLLAVGGFLLAAAVVLLATDRRKPAKPAKNAARLTPATLRAPAEELIRAASDGRLAIWAGAGLAAQSGYPSRSEFVDTVLQRAAQDGWVDAVEGGKLLVQSARGDGERAMNQLVAGLGDRRPLLAAAVSEVYSSYAVPSISHELLARLAPRVAITTNYDGLLDRISFPSGLVKLFGGVAFPSALIFSRFELQAAARPANLGRSVREILGTNIVLFLGCSLDGLLEDLEAFGVPASGKHYAVCGVAGPEWEKAAGRLENSYGVRVIPCSAHTIHAELPEYLLGLTEAVDAARASAASPQLAGRR